MDLALGQNCASPDLAELLRITHNSLHIFDATKASNKRRLLSTKNLLKNGKGGNPLGDRK
jgi:hypothetical protein